MKFVPAKHFYSGRSRPINLIVLHTTESPESSSGAENVANYFKNPSVPSSCHIVVDNNSEVQCVKDEDTAWAAPGANANGLQLEMVGRASQTPKNWSDDYSKALLARAAKIVATWCVVHKIPVTVVKAAGLKKNASGITTHAEVTKAFNKSSHTDPGAGFPMDSFIALVKKEIAAMPKKVVNDETVVDETVVEEEVKGDSSLPEVINDVIDDIVAEQTLVPMTDVTATPYPGTLRLGSSGDGVVALQQALNRKDAKLEVDGDLGVKTLGALQRFERSVGFPSVGVLSPAVWDALVA